MKENAQMKEKFNIDAIEVCGFIFMLLNIMIRVW